ncbi:MAG TPA: response regulator [Prolixibacteraceae bacterium]
MKKIEAPIKVLHLEDSLSDSLLVQLNLKKENLNFEYYFADNENDFKAHLTNQSIDIILSDYNLPGYSGADALALIKNNYQHIPFVFVSGALGEEAAIESLLNGATDYVLKNKLEKLGPAVKRALRESQLQQEYQKAIDNLRKKEKQYHMLVEGMNEGIMLSDINDTILFVNQQTCDITGYTTEELTGTICSEILYDSVNQKIIQDKKRFWKQGIKDIFEIELLKKDKKKLWIRISNSPVFDEKGMVTGSISVFENIDDQKKAEDELRKLTRAVDQSPGSIVITDTEGIIEYTNPATANLSGFTIEEMTDGNTSIFGSGKIQDDFEQIRESVKSGKIWDGEFQNRRKNGELYWESSSISPIFDNSGAITHLLAIREDVSERKKLTQELTSAKERAEESDRLKSAFLANISHEIRTPMNGILGFAELLKIPKLSPDAQKRYIHIIEQSGNRMLNIISDIVDISKIESGQMDINIQETNVNQLLNDILVLHSSEAVSKGLLLSFSATLPNEKSNIQTDHVKLTQILTNLIKNALKFTKSGTINFGYTKKGEILEFFVKDTGVGISKDQAEMIFERFRQGSVAFTREYEGAGLGLSISKALVNMLGGKIWVNSEPGKGSVFFFQIPSKPQNERFQEIATDKFTEPESHSIHILIAEDDENSIIYVTAILEDENTIIYEAKNGKQAVELVKNHPEIDLVLMDLKMPFMDGFEAARQIKKLRPSLPIIAQTAYAFSEDEEKARQAGCDDYISKPIKKQVLVEKIHELYQKEYY